MYKYLVSKTFLALRGCNLTEGVSSPLFFSKKAESLRTFVHSDNPEALQTSLIERGQKPLLSQG